jgi:uncharacterized protein (DUF58 family)
MTNCKIKTARIAAGFLAFVLFGLAAVVTGNSGTTIRPFSLTIRLLQNVAKVGSEIRVQVVLTNTSDHEIGILKSAPEADYIVEVRDTRGKMAPDTDFRRKQKDPASVKVSTASPLYTLKPGESLRDEIQVERLYEMSAPGKYSIQVSRTVPEEMGSGIVKSNMANVTITP